MTDELVDVLPEKLREQGMQDRVADHVENVLRSRGVTLHVDPSGTRNRCEAKRQVLQVLAEAGLGSDHMQAVREVLDEIYAEPGQPPETSVV